MTDLDQLETTRRRLLAGGTAAATVASSPTLISMRSVLPSGALTPLATADPDAQPTFGSASVPMWAIGLDRDELVDEDSDDDPADQLVNNLETWVDNASEDDRHLIDTFHSIDIAIVAGTKSDIGATNRARLRRDGLAFRSWVRFVDANLLVSLVDPIQPWNIEENADDLSYSVDPFAFSSDFPSNDGLAFDEDAPEATVGTVWETVNARNHGVDTGGLTVAVIDTGVTDSSEFRIDTEDGTETRILNGSADTTGDDLETVEQEGITLIADENGHGNWVASSMLADHEDPDYDGVLMNADILGLKALGDGGSGSTQSILRAVDHAVENGADVACMSLGTPLYSHALADAIETATDEGTVVVAATGNDRFGTTFVSHPASVEESIAVNAITADTDSEEAQVAYFGNPGPHDGVLDQSGGESNGATPDLVAPGMKVEADTPDGLSRLSGTSMAAPFVAAAAGLLVADGVDPADVRDQLTAAAEPLPEGGEYEVGAGRLEVDRALTDTESEEDQLEVRNSAAETRDVSLEGYSGARGGRLGSYLAEDLEDI